MQAALTRLRPCLPEEEKRRLTRRGKWRILGEVDPAWRRLIRPARNVESGSSERRRAWCLGLGSDDGVASQQSCSAERRSQNRGLAEEAQRRQSSVGRIACRGSVGRPQGEREAGVELSST